MIIKGSSRGGASQLGPYLLSTKENTRAKLIEIVSPIDDLTQSLEDWQTLADGTKQGKKGLYHAQIAPEGRYQMTDEQWKRCVEVLEEELGLTGQPRAVVLHEKNGKEHLHVVWQRTDLETMKFMSDSNNYQAHERASQRLEQEFGHEEVPGKHSKRQKKDQPPLDEAQRQKDAALKETIARLYAQSDNAQAFKAALEQEGYILAKGDRRPHIIVDADGKEYSLTRCLPDIDTKDLKQFMAGIDRNTLPTAEEAKALQKEAPERPEERKAETPDQPPPPEEPPKPPDPPKEKPDRFAEDRAKLEAALKNRHDFETHQLLQRNNTEQQRLVQNLERIKDEKVFELRALHKETLDQYDREHERGWFATKLAALRSWFDPAKEETRTRERAEFYVVRREELNQQIYALKKTIYKEQDALAARHAQELAEHQRRFEEERARHLRDAEHAARIAAEIEQKRHQEKYTPKPTPPPDHPL